MWLKSQFFVHAGKKIVRVTSEENGLSVSSQVCKQARPLARSRLIMPTKA